MNGDDNADFLLSMGIGPGDTVATPADLERLERERTLTVGRVLRTRNNGPSALLAALDVGKSHLFTQYLVSAQISATVGRVAAILNRTYRCERVHGEGVRVTRVL